MKIATTRGRHDKAGTEVVALSTTTVLIAESGWVIKMFLKALVVMMFLCSVPAFASKTEAQFDADQKMLEDEIRQNHPEVIWVNGKFTVVTL